ncbi:Kelch motif protein [compost metagenome]
MLGGNANASTNVPSALIQTTTVRADGSLNPWSNYGGMTTWRLGAGVHVLNDKIWHVGGSNNTAATPLASTEYFTVLPDGSLGPSTVGPSLNTPRYKPESFVVSAGGNRYLYVVGGYNVSVYLNSVERAVINADGTLGPFVLQASTTVHARGWTAGAVIGRYFYLFGGQPSKASVERAAINPDGSLGGFQLLGMTLPDAIGDHRAIVIGNHVHLLGAHNGTAPLSAVYSAPIYPDGTLGAFAAGPPLIAAMADVAPVQIGNYLYTFGGWGGGSTFYNIVQRAFIEPGGALGAWQAYKSDRYVLPFSVAYVLGVPVYQDSIYFFSGYNGSGPVQAIAQGTVH